MNILRRIQNQPEKTRKIILWLIVIIIGTGLLIWWIKNFQQRFESFKVKELKEELNLPSFEEELEKFPKLEMPKLNEKE